MKHTVKKITGAFKYRYQRIMFLVFMAIALGITIFGTGNVICNTAQTERNQNRMLAQSNAQSLSVTYTVAAQTVNNIRLSSEVSQWAAAASAAEERLAAASLHSVVGRQMTGLEGLQYTVGMWKLNSYAPVVYINGYSFDKDTYISEQFGMDATAWEQAVATAREGGSYFLATAGTPCAEELVCLYYHKYVRGEVVFFILLPCGEDENSWALASGGRLLASNDPENQTLVKTIDGNSATPRGVYIEPIVNEHLQYVYLVPDKSLQQAGTYILVFLLLLGIGTVFMFLITRQIYKPIDRLLHELDIQPVKGQTDEFALLRDNTVHLQLLNKKIHDALNDTILQQKEEKYIRLLYGLAHDPEDPGTRSICLVLFDFDESANGDQLFVAKNDMRLYTQQDHLVFLGIQPTRWALILYDTTPEDACEKNRRLLDLYLAELPVTAIVGGQMRGITAFRQAYRQVLRTLDMHAVTHTGEILRADQFKTGGPANFRYPVSIESEIIHGVLEGDNAALEALDDNLRDNLGRKTLPPQQVENYLLALSSTANRIYNLLPAQVQSMAPRPVSGAEVLMQYDSQGETIAVKALRGCMEGMTHAVAGRRSADNTQLMQKMLTYIHENYMRDIGLTDVADHVGITPQYCSLAFKQLTNDNFKNYLNGYRIKQARALQDANPGISTTELADRVGFNSANSFIRAYKKYTGISPQNYRKGVSQEEAQNK